MSKPAHIERMEIELADLTDKFTKLDTFVAANPVFPTLEAEDRNLLEAQSIAMKHYARLLGARIERANAD